MERDISAKAVSILEELFVTGKGCGLLGNN